MKIGHGRKISDNYSPWQMTNADRFMFVLDEFLFER